MPDRKHRFPFSQARLAKLPTPAEGRETWYDSKAPGLCLRKTHTGAASFYLYRWHAGRPVKIRLGPFPALSLVNARDAAAAAVGDIAKGADPAVRRTKAGGRMTLGDLWAHYLDQHAKPHKRTWRVDEQRYNRHLKTWAGRRLVAITASDLQGLHNRVGKESGHYEANRLRSLLHTLYAVARRHLGYRGDNPVTNVQRFKEESRERYLHGDELPRFFQALDGLREQHPTAADAIAVALWTGARRGNVLSMTWEELALDRATWTIPGDKFKNGKQQSVHLPSPALDILRRRQADAKGPWVFPGRRLGKHLSDPAKPWETVLTAAGLADLRIHDLRRTMGSWQAATGASLPVIGKSLGHLNQGTTAVYARLDLAPVREAVDKAAAAMVAAGKPEKGGATDESQS
jgi:integrase